LEYLATHKVAKELRIALGGRTLSKVQKFAEKQDNWEAVYVDVGDEDSVLAAVTKSRVVMSLAGPWWTHGSTVVR
jgi:saccharopine dehydrogenase-like NADP-dependent oxidoreductase